MGGLSAEKIDTLLRKWLHLLPHPFTGADRQAGYRYALSIRQAEFSLTQALDRPAHGRLFFEQAIRENLDLGRPEEVQLIFNRTVTRRTPGQFRTRIVTQDVTPSLNVYCKHTRIKQYRKENRAFVPRRLSTTLTTSASAGGCTICRNCAKSALPPVDGCSSLASTAGQLLLLPTQTQNENRPPGVDQRHLFGLPSEQRHELMHAARW